MKYLTILCVLLITSCSGGSGPDQSKQNKPSGSKPATQTPAPTQQMSKPPAATPKPPAAQTDQPKPAEQSNAPASESEQSGAKQRSFSIDKYREIAKRLPLSNQTLAGTWVAVWETAKERSNIQNEPVVAGSPLIILESIEVVVIRAGKETGEYEVASCYGKGFEKVKRVGNEIKTDSRTFIVVDNRNMTAIYNRSDSWDLAPRPGTPTNVNVKRTYDEMTTAAATYVKMSDKTGRISELTQTWIDDKQEIKKDIYCADIEVFKKDGLNRVRLGSDDAMEFTITSSDLDPAVPLARVLEPNFKNTTNRKGLLDTGETLCKAYFNFEEPLPVNKNLEFDYRYTIIEQLPHPDDPGATLGERKLTGSTLIDLNAL